MRTRYDPNKYGKLLFDTLPGVIETEDENERALEIVWGLMKRVRATCLLKKIS